VSRSTVRRPNCGAPSFILADAINYVPATRPRR